MPTYHARGVSLRLGAMPLADTVTPKIVLRKGEIARKQSEEAEEKLLSSAFLPEERVSFPGVEDDFQLQWLGDAPFMQVQADSDVCQQYNYDDAEVVPTLDFHRQSQNPLALALHVKMSEKTFISGLDSANKVHLKIEVFFNGKLSSCLFVPYYEIRSGAKSLHQVFAGYRVDYLVERPWVILPPKKNADGRPRKSKAAQSSQKRWADISNALVADAEQRGADEEGNIPPTAQFLKALSSMQMPDQIQSMQTLTGSSFGTIDVVITAGEGRKITTGTTYLKNPQRLTDEKYALGSSFMSTLERSLDNKHYESTTFGRPKAYVMTGNDVDCDSDSDYQPQPKRRALALPVLSMRFSQHASLPSVVHNEVGTEKITPTQVAMQGPFEASLSSPERRLGFQEYADYTDRNVLDVTQPSIPHSFEPFPSSSLGLTYPPKIQLTPHSLPQVEPTLDFDSPGNLAHLSSTDNLDVLSNPLCSFPRSTHVLALPQHGPQRTLENELAQVPSGPTPELVEQTLVPPRGPVGSGYATPGAPIASWDGYSSARGLPLNSSNDSPGYVPNMVPLSRDSDHNPPTVFNGLPDTSTDSRLSMPLPPIGLFSVPTKPRSSHSPSKDLRTDKKGKECNLFVKRLKILGKNGSTIVDHRWANPQRIIIQPGNGIGSACGSLLDRRSAKSSRVDLIKTSHTEFPSHDPTVLKTSLVTKGLNATTGRGGSVEAGAAKQRKKKQGSTCIKEHDAIADSVRPFAGEGFRPTMAQRRTSSNNNILGVQGPKATTFWLEDPEEVLREAARIRRSRSPHKLRNKPDLQHMDSTEVVHTQENCVTDSFSPLSSLATTPEPDAAIPSESCSSVLATGITQVDGPSDRRSIVTSPAALALPPVKLAFTASPQCTRKTPSTSMSSPSLKSKKRKSQGRCLPKMPRSPDRLRTTSNPPLNQNCVIAFSESEDKDSDQGVLRQVKGERQGVFTEDYVVLATRFFIPGN